MGDIDFVFNPFFFSSKLLYFIFIFGTGESFLLLERLEELSYFLINTPRILRMM